MDLLPQPTVVVDIVQVFTLKPYTTLLLIVTICLLFLARHTLHDSKCKRRLPLSLYKLCNSTLNCSNHCNLNQHHCKIKLLLEATSSGIFFYNFTYLGNQGLRRLAILDSHPFRVRSFGQISHPITIGP